MARLIFLLALCALPLLIGAATPPYHIQGKVYCDTCRAGFETNVTTYMKDVKVRVECTDRVTLKLKFSIEYKTDSTGTYNIKVDHDHTDDICYVKLISSPVADCQTPDPVRYKAPIIITDSNGIASRIRYANAMGYWKNTPLSVCVKLLKAYLENGDRFI